MAGSAISKHLLQSKQKHLILTKQTMQSDKLLQAKQLKTIPERIDIIIIKLVNLQTFKVYLDSSLTCSELKHLIFKFLSQTLKPEQMMLQINEKRIGDDQVLSSIIAVDSVIIQKKAPLRQRAKTEFFSKIQDDFTLQKGVLQMICGHKIGRQSIIQMMKMIINTKKSTIVCPYPECSQEWSYEDCKNVGCFTYQQDKFFNEGLRRNWQELNTIECPSCKKLATKSNKMTNKIVCSNPKCKLKIFCCLCMNKWGDPSKSSCQNVKCNFNHQFLNQVTTKPFQFYDVITNKNFQLQIPTHRLCPRCSAVIEHYAGCKHMTCINCQTMFCFVCLEVLQKEWKCGAYNAYCGKIAQKQTLT